MRFASMDLTEPEILQHRAVCQSCTDTYAENAVLESCIPMARSPSRNQQKPTADVGASVGKVPKAIL